MTHLLTAATTLSFTNASNPEVAQGQANYLRNQFTFFGLKRPIRDELQKELLKDHPITLFDELVNIAQSFWELEQREYQLFALDILVKYKKLYKPELLPVIKKLITTKSWWDTVDLMASKIVGGLLLKHPELRNEMDAWIKSENMWLRRTALLFQLKYKEKTDYNRLFYYITLCMYEKEFFIQKAIGWMLREHSKIRPDLIASFINEYEDRLAKLSIREGSKYL